MQDAFTDLALGQSAPTGMACVARAALHHLLPVRIPLGQSRFFHVLQVGAGKRVFQLMDRVPQLPPSGSQKPTGSPAGAALDFQAVSFAYPSRPNSWVLKDFNLQVRCPSDWDRRQP